MPNTPLKPCRQPGCHELTRDAYCPVHKPRDNRASSPRRGYGRKHAAWRGAVMRRDKWLCQSCLAEGRLVPAKIADHVTPWQRGGDKYALANGQALCQRCHNAKTRRETASVADYGPGP